ncbi:hypothetical protein [endosymbiont of Lamellibrachia barhami]|uniref:hypothetical protein n=1 Tax=endosymbiont of Lamellibrachia barhami TaxID=205975 RepID=UPI0024841927
MTAYAVFHEPAEGNIRLDEEVLISQCYLRTGGSKMFIEVGKRVRLGDLIIHDHPVRQRCLRGAGGTHRRQ